MRKPLKNFLLTCPLALATLLAPILFENQATILIVCLIIIAILLFMIERSKRDFLLYLGGFVSGPLAEAVAIHFGEWHYTNPVFVGIPLWLPFVWGIAAIYIVRLKAVIDFYMK